MAKKVVAVTNIKHGTKDGEKYVFEAGEELDPTKFTKKQLQELYEMGSIRVDGEDDQKTKEAEEKLESGEENVTGGSQPINPEAPQVEDPKPASSAATAKGAAGTPVKGVTETSTKGVSSAKK